MKPKKLWPSLCAGALLLGGTAPAQTVGSDSWAATDALGRKVRDYQEAGAKKPDKFVAMFYWTWHQGNDDTTYRVKNITEIVRQHPEAMKDYHHPAWGTKQPGFFFWEQPLLGYYKTTDPWVLRKHAEMLADAGVDAVFFDCTNGSLTWQDSYEALLKTWDQAQKDGVNVPKIAFMLPFGPAPHSLVSLRQLYNDLYKPGRYENLWFVWKGKPCIMAYPDNLTDSPTDRAIADFFTFRPGQPDYVDGPTRNDQWGWLEVYPQHGYVKSPDGDFEQVAVGIAQNTSPDRKGHCGAFNVKDAYGRNFSVRNGFDPRVDGYLYGWNFDEQWERAYELDPELVFVTGWNEWTAGKYQPGGEGKTVSWLRRQSPFFFVDQYNAEFNRCIHPVKGGYTDNYYMQMAQNLRRYKGARPIPRLEGYAEAKADGDFGEWDAVTTEYRDTRGDVFHRDAKGYAGLHYVDTSGRNDILTAKVAVGRRAIGFYAETADALTPSDGNNWMLLLIDADNDSSTGWYGYDFVINKKVKDGRTTTLMRYDSDSEQWIEAAELPYRYEGNRLEVIVPRKLLGLTGDGFTFDFKWSDNAYELEDPISLCLHGDTAPNRRFNYRCIWNRR